MSDNNKKSDTGVKVGVGAAAFLFGFDMVVLSVATGGLALPILGGMAAAALVTKMMNSGESGTSEEPNKPSPHSGKSSGQDGLNKGPSG
jgi:hypothetical protein